MLPPDDPPAFVPSENERWAQLEARLARIEAHLGLGAGPLASRESTPAPAAPPAVASAEAAAVQAAPSAGENEPPAALAPVFGPRTSAGDEFEMEMGQNWFALAGIVVLTVGVAFMLSLPYARLPAALPAAAGFGLVGLLLTATHLGRQSLGAAVEYLRGAALALGTFSALRLFFFGATPALDVAGPAGRAFLLAVGAASVAVAAGWRSPGLTGLAGVSCAVLALAVGTAPFVFLFVAGMAVVGVGVGRKFAWGWIQVGAIVLSYFTYFLWAVGNPLRGGGFHVVKDAAWAPGALLGIVVVLGIGPLLRPGRRRDDALANASAVLNCGLGYGVILLHSAAYPGAFAALHLAATVAFLGLAVGFFLRVESRLSTFFYAMTGYAALSAAILKLSTSPDVFVWLSLQSVVVVATAIWFRSRFIVVANFFIFAAIVAGYVVIAARESGISVGFGIVALVSARILNWQKDRLELKTELMRNAYLVSAAVVFPYALYHLVAAKFVALAWVGLAAVYYLLNLAVRNQKYRWMGHATLGLSTVYVAVAAVSRFEPVYRVLSFLVLGSVMLIVSISFARARRKAG